MGMIIGLIGMFGFLVCLVLLIVALMKKGNKNKYLKGLGITFILFIVGIALTPGSEEETSSVNDTVVPSFAEVVEAPVMNGSKTEQIGIYATVDANGVEINEENLIKFYEEKVKDSGYNWVTLILEDGKGIQFAASSVAFTYGEIDEEACITKGLGDGFIFDGTIDYEER